ncbi:Sec20p, partial [Ascoidea rubescens DSM 1968]
KQQILHKNESISIALKNSHKLLQSSILQSDLNIDELSQSSNSLQLLSNKYQSLEFILNKSSRLVKELEQADRIDKKNIRYALYWLTFTICWVIWRRLLSKPVLFILTQFLTIFKLALYFLKFFQKNNSHDTILSYNSISTPQLQFYLPTLSTTAT